MAKFHPPENLDFSKPQEWSIWKTRFERFRIATKLQKEDEIVQVSSLIYAMGQQAEQIYKSFTFTGDEGDKFDPVIAKFNAYFIPKRNIIYERAMFHRRSQNSGESVESFVRALFDLAEYAEFADKEEQIRDRLVIGLTDKDVSEKLQLTAGLDLAKAIEIARQSEQVKVQMNEGATASAGALEMGVNMVNKFHRSKDKPRTAPNAYGSKGKYKVCSRCAKGVHNFDKCPAKGKTCSKCGKLGHFAQVCFTSGPSGHSQNSYSTSKRVNEVTNEFFLGSVSCDDSDSDEWCVDLIIKETKINFKIDTGADTSIMSENEFNNLKVKPNLEPCDGIRLRSPGGVLQCIGQFVAKVTYKSNDYSFRVFVVKGQVNNLLGRSEANQMGMIKRVQEVNSNSVFGEIGLMDTKPVKISLKEDAIPHCTNVSRRIALPLYGKVREEIDRMSNMGVISKITEPTDWCAPMVPVPKPNGKLRLCVDLKKLNQSVKRELYILPTVEDIAHKLLGATVFSTLDCSSSFWQLPLDKESAKLTTFISPFGRYHFNRVPYGLSSATEILQKRLSELLENVDGVFVDIDDLLVFGCNTAEHDKYLAQVLRIIHDAGLKLNKSKCKFRQKSVTYQGQRFSAEGMSPNPEKVQAIIDLPPPTNVKQVRQFLGMINYLGRYLSDLSIVLRPISQLLQEDIEFVWDSPQEEAYKNVKQLVSTAPVLAYYDQRKPTVVSADASSYGIGGVIMQDDKPIAYCSRVLSPAEKSYAQIEKECLASVWACEKFTRYLTGLESFKLITDHKPLVPIINKKSLDDAPVRCQRLLMRLMKFNLVAEHAPGKSLVVADTLSRNPIPDVCVDELEEDINLYVNHIESSWPVSDIKLTQIALETEKDTVLSVVMKYVLNGWPQYIRDVSDPAKDYFCVRGQLSVYNGLLVNGCKIVVPKSLRSDILNRIHNGHQGINKCRDRANEAVWWPRISTDIQNIVQNCEFCQIKIKTQNSEPLIPTPMPERPWDKVGVDLFDFKSRKYLVVVDYFSRYIEIAELASANSKTVIGKLKGILVRHGLCLEMVSDNGPPFNSREFQQFAEEYHFVHTFSSPYFAQANGEAERAVQEAKKILSTQDPYLAILSYRATAHSATGYSPAELSMGRKLRTTLPMLPENLAKSPDLSLAKRNDNIAKQSYKKYFDKRHGAKLLPSLNVGDRVRVKLNDEKIWSNPVVVKEKYSSRSYIVDNGDKSFRRNRKHLQLIPNSVSTSDAESDAVCSGNVVSSDISNSSLQSPLVSVSPKKPLDINTPSTPQSVLEPKRSCYGRIIKPVKRLDL